MNKFYLWVCTKNCDKTISQIIGSIVARNLKVSHSAKVTSNNQVAVVPLEIVSQFSLKETLKTVNQAIAELPAFFVLLTEPVAASWDLPSSMLPKAEEVKKVIDTGAKLVENGKLQVKIIPPVLHKDAEAPSIPPITLSILSTLNKVVKASCSLSDVFFEGVTKEERILLSESLDKLIEGGLHVEGK